MWRSVCGGLVLLAGLSGVSTTQAQDVDQLLEAVGAVAPQASFAADRVTPASRSGDELRPAVKASLARTLVDGALVTDQAAVRELTQVHRELKQDDSLAATERAELQRTVSQRLSALAGQLRRRLPQASQHILGQQNNPFAAGFGQQPNQGQGVDPAQELIELIQDTIGPSTWDVRGGQGVIRFWGSGQALIIRQSSDVHGALAQLIEDLHP